MKKIAILIGFLIMAAGISAQNDTGNVKLRREQKKAKQNEANAQSYKTVKALVDSMDFVLEAEYLGTKWGDKFPVPSQLNFIMVDSSNVTIQVGSNSRIGRNGVGGVTAEGSISNLKIHKNDKNQTVFLSFTAMTHIGIYDISMNISGSGYAEATLSGLTSQKLVYYGYLVKRENSMVYKGQSGF